MRSVAVTGAAGALGQQVVATLAGRPGASRIVAIDITAPADLGAPAGRSREGRSRKGRSREGRSRKGRSREGRPREGRSWEGVVDHHRIDLAASPVGPDPLAELLGGTDGVIHLAWTTGDGRAGGDVQPAGEANLRALRRVLRAAPATAVVHLSSATVYGAWNDNAVPLTEDLPLRPNPGFDFAVQKAEAERIVAEWSAGHPGASVCVLRPCVTLGVPGRPLYQALGGTRAPGTGDGARRVQFLHLDDLAAAVVFAWDHQLVGTFNVAPDSGTSDHVARALSGGWARLRLPERVARGLGRLGWHLWRSGVPRPAQPYNLHPWVVAPDRLVAAGWQARFSSEEALVATDDRAHWDDLPPGRRQELTLLAGAGGALALLAALATAARAWGRHHRRD